MSRVRVLISCLLCSLVALAVWPAGATAKGGPGPTAGIIPLYRVEPLYGRVLIPLDPVTLDDNPSLGGVTLGLRPVGGPYDFIGEPPQIVVSPDGTKMAVVTACAGCQGPSDKYSTVRIVTSSGRQLASWHPPKPMDIEFVSNDGKQVMGLGVNVKSNKFASWLVLNGKNGRVMQRVGGLEGTYEPALNRFYIGNTDGTTTYSLTAYDAGTGAMISRLPLPNVVVNTTLEKMPNGRSLINDTWPVFAISPDGQRIAVVDGATETLTVIDAPHLRVLSTESIHEPESWAQQLGEFLGIIPSAAEAKGPLKGTMLSARFSRDGRSLYVTGETGTPDADGISTDWSYLPLRRIDVATGQILAQQAEDGGLDIVGQSVDGGALFALARTNDYRTELREYDASTLQLLASRVFNEAPSLVLLRPPST